MIRIVVGEFGQCSPGSSSLGNCSPDICSPDTRSPGTGSYDTSTRDNCFGNSPADHSLPSMLSTSICCVLSHAAGETAGHHAEIFAASNVKSPVLAGWSHHRWQATTKECKSPQNALPPAKRRCIKSQAPCITERNATCIHPALLGYHAKCPGSHGQSHNAIR